MRQPLCGYKVIELATVVAAPTAGRVMSDFGASVIKIETPAEGDFIRKTADALQLPTEKDNNPLFDLYNSGKKLLSLNLKTEEGLAIFFRLLEGADVFITNMREKSLIKLGIDYGSIKDRFPSLVYAHLAGYGPKGPDSERPGFDTTAFWLRSGAAVDSVLPGNLPVRPPFGMGDTATAGYFLSGILMALLARDKSGMGTYIESSLFNSGLWHSSAYILNCQPQYGRKYPPDRYDPWDPVSDFYKCSDGEWIAPVKKVYEKERFIFAEVFDIPEFVEDPDYESLSRMAKSGKKAECTRKLEEAISKKASEEWVRILTENDVPCERAAHYIEAQADPQAWENSYLEAVSYPGEITSAVPTPPIVFSEYERRSFRRQGYIGKDTDEVLEELGYTRQEIEEMKHKGVL